MMKKTLIIATAMFAAVVGFQPTQQAEAKIKIGVSIGSSYGGYYGGYYGGGYYKGGHGGYYGGGHGGYYNSYYKSKKFRSGKRFTRKMRSRNVRRHSRR